MIQFFSIILTSLFLSLNLFAANKSCQLPAGETLTIGCSTDCGRSIKVALRKYASKQGLKVKIVDMSDRGIDTDYSKIDGIVIPGGEDIDPVHYKYEVEEDLRQRIEELDHLVDYTREGARRDRFELKMLKNYFKNNQNKTLPLLGICRGMQILTVSQKIPLYIDINAELGIPNRRSLDDKVYVLEGSTLIEDIVERKSFLAYKNHHQGLRVAYFKKYQAQRWPHLNVTAYSNNNLIAEALEFKNRPVLGVQFHPEVDRGHLREKIFSWVLNESCHNKNNKLNSF